MENPSARHELDRRLAAFLKLASRHGWEILSHDDLGVMLRLRRCYSPFYLWGGVLTLPLFGVGLLVWLIGAIDLWSTRDRLLFVPLHELMSDKPGELADLLV